MSLFQTSIKTKKIKKEKWAAALNGFDEVSADDEAWNDPLFDPALGTLGGGNHFAELQAVEKVLDEPVLRHWGADPNRLFLLVHSGSRYHGERLYREHTGRWGAGPVTFGTPDADDFLKRYTHAVNWASENRHVIGDRFMDCIGGRCHRLLDLCHNSIDRIEKKGTCFGLHRKGAVPSDKGLVVIPGSRGSFSYLVLATGDQEKNLWSLAHGAGRKWNRGSCKGKLEGSWTLKSLKRTDLGSIVVCDDRDALFEEAPQAYKKIETVIEAMVESGLIRIIAILKPVITSKGGV